MINSGYDGPDRRHFERKIFESGMSGYMRHIGQNKGPTTNEVYPVAIHDIDPKGIGLELILPKKRKNLKIDEILLNDIFTIYYLISSSCAQFPKIEDMQVVNVIKLNEEKSAYEIFKIGAKFLKPTKNDDYKFEQSNKIARRLGPLDHKQLVDEVFGISGNSKCGFLPQNMNVEGNLARLGYRSKRL